MPSLLVRQLDDATIRKVLKSWGPGKYDAEVNQDGKAFRPDGKSGATLIPAAFGQAAAMSVERAWRCRDKLQTAGLRAMTRGVPGFVWEGIEIDLMPAVLAEIVADEHVELRALFYWLCDQGIQSPWQDNLRGE